MSPTHLPRSRTYRLDPAKIVAAMREKNWEKEDLINYTDLSDKTVDAVLRGQKGILRNTLERIAHALDKSLQYFLPSEREAYLRRLAEEFEWLDFGGLAPQAGTEILRIPLDDLFVSPTLDHAIRPTPRLSQADLGILCRCDDHGTDTPVSLNNEQTAIVDNALGAPAQYRQLPIAEALFSSRIVILGDTGSGKTTLLRRLARAAALQQHALLRRNKEWFPVYLQLAEYDSYCEQHAITSLTDYVLIAARAHERPLSQDVLSQEMAAGRCIFLLDALDEIANAARRMQVRNRVQEFAQAHQCRDCRIIVTSRRIGYRDASLPTGPGGFDHLMLRPFEVPEVNSFARRWYAAIANHGLLTDVSRQNSEALCDAIQADSSVRELATNPLLLTLLALMYWRELRLPTRRIELYRIATETLLRTWVRRRAAQLQWDDREAVWLLMAAAFHIRLRATSGFISAPELEKVLVARKLGVEAEQLEYEQCRYPGKAQQADQEVAHFLHRQVDHVGLLDLRGFDHRRRPVFSFVHATFEEYLAGRELARRWQQGALKLSQFLHKAEWEQPILLACAHLSELDDEIHAARFILAILRARSPYEAALHRDLMLAAQCLNEDPCVPQAVPDQILDRLKRLFRTTPNVVLRDLIISGLIGLLTGRFALKARNALLELKGSPAWPSQVSFDLDASTQGSKKQMSNIRRPYSFIFEPQKLDQQVRLVLPVRRDLKMRTYRALKNQNPNVRIEAADALFTSLGKLPPRAEKVIRDALGHDDLTVRVKAAQVLAKLRPCPPEALRVLREYLRNASEKDRESVTYAIIPLGSEAVSYLEQFLRTRDSDGPVALASVYALAHIDSLQATDLLRKSLKHRDACVRAAAASALVARHRHVKEALTVFHKLLGRRDVDAAFEVFESVCVSLFPLKERVARRPILNALSRICLDTSVRDSYKAGFAFMILSYLVRFDPSQRCPGKSIPRTSRTRFASVPGGLSTADSR